MIDRFMDWLRDLLDPYPFVRKAVVHTKTGRSIEGVLWRRKRGYLIMREASILEHGKAVPLDGETVIDRANVDFIQVLAPVGSEP